MLIKQISEKISNTLLAASIGSPFKTSSDRVIRSGTASRAFAAAGFLVAGCGIHFIDKVLIMADFDSDLPVDLKF
jgi:hypothetical protein